MRVPVSSHQGCVLHRWNAVRQRFRPVRCERCERCAAAPLRCKAALNAWASLLRALRRCPRPLGAERGCHPAVAGARLPLVTGRRV